MMEDKVWYRGTTPTLTFTLPFSTSQIQVGYICVKQGNTIILRDMEKCSVDDKSISTKLTQEETLRLSTKMPVKIQFRCKTLDNTSLATAVVERTIKDILKDGII